MYGQSTRELVTARREPAEIVAEQAVGSPRAQNP